MGLWARQRTCTACWPSVEVIGFLGLGGTTESPCSIALLDTGKRPAQGVSWVGQSQSDFMTEVWKPSPGVLWRPGHLCPLSAWGWSLPCIQEVSWEGGKSPDLVSRSSRSRAPTCFAGALCPLRQTVWSRSPGQRKPRPLTLCSVTRCVPSSARRVKGRPDCSHPWTLQRQPPLHEQALKCPEHAKPFHAWWETLDGFPSLVDARMFMNFLVCLTLFPGED